MTQDQLCNIVNNAKCCVGDKGLELIDSLHKGHDVGCCYQELLFMSRAIHILENHIPAGTLESTAAVNACGQTNTIIGFAPIPPIVLYHGVTFDYNGNPLTTFDNTTLTGFMQDVVDALTAASGVTWSFTQIDTWNFFLCAPYTQNGDTVNLVIQTFSESSVGDITMNVTLNGGIAPTIPPVYRKESDNCLTENEIAILSGRFCKIRVKKLNNIDRAVDVEIRQDLLDLELR